MDGNASEASQAQFTADSSATLSSTISSQRVRARRKPKVEWTTVMCEDLLECKEKAKSISESETAPRKPNGRKVGYMEIMYNLWNDKGYSHLNLTAQNLRDRVSQLLIQRVNVQETIVREASRPNDINEEEREPCEDQFLDASNQLSPEQNANLSLDENQSQIPQLESEQNNNDKDKYYTKANEIFNEIHVNVGDYSMRQYDTRTKRMPTRKDLGDLNKSTNKLINEQKFTNTTNPLKILWVINCIIYAVIASWVEVNNVKVRAHGTFTSPNSFQPKWLREIETQVRETRTIISKATAEIERLRCNGKLRKKGRKNRDELAKECNVLSVRELVILIERKKTVLRKLSRKRRRKSAQREAKKLNDMFRHKTGKVFEEFKNIIQEDSSNLRPVYKSITKSSSSNVNYFESITEVENFWKDLWSVQARGNPNPDWIKDIEDTFCEIVPEVDEGVQEIKKESLWNAIRKKKNWSSPGPDKVVNFWWKKIVSTHHWIRKAFQELINQSCQIPQWFSSGKTFLIPKDGTWSVDNQRPITCTNTLYKWYTSIILGKLDNHLSKYNLMQIDQRGAKASCNGTAENLLIDGMVLNDARSNSRNLSCAWIDIRKAYDNLSHQWIIKTLNIHRIPTKLSNTIQNIVKSWSVKLMIPTQSNLTESSIISFKRGILQGDSMCPKLFTMALNPIAWSIRASDGYRMSKPLQCHKITHNFFIDDLKMYAGSESKLANVMSDVKQQMEDAGLEWNEKKCSVVHMKRGKLQSTGGDILIDDDMLVKALVNGEFYKFLGVPEADRQEVDKFMQRLTKELTQRVSVIWSSPLSDYNKIQATNGFAIPVVSYAMWSQRINLEELREMDRIIRKVMNENSAKHPKLSNATLYLPRYLGGRGLTSVEQLYKETRIKTMAYILSSKDPRVEVLVQHERVKALKNRSSIFKDAKKYAEEMRLKIEDEEEFRITFQDEVREDEINGEQGVKEILKKARVTRLKSQIQEQTWQGVILTSRFHDNTLDPASFQWLSRWKECPVALVSEVQGLYNQLLPTKTYMLLRSGNHPPTNTVCRMCGKGQESVMHILSGCSKLAETDYLRRHNKALTILITEVLIKFKFIEQRPSWFSPIQIKPYYDNNLATVWWDIPEEFGELRATNAKRPDAKILDKMNRSVTIIEQSIPWISNRETKEIEKQEKYEDVRRNNRIKYKGHTVDQANIIMDGLGGFSPNLRVNIKKIIGEKRVVEEIIYKMQKVVVSEAAHIARKFKLSG